MFPLLNKLKLVGYSLIIFGVQILIWIPLELLSLNGVSNYFFIYLSTNLFVFYLLYFYFQTRLKLESLTDLFLIGFSQVVLSIFILVGEDTAKIRAIEFPVYILFILIYWLSLRKFNFNKRPLITIVICFSFSGFLLYEKVSNYALALFFNEIDFKQTTKRHDEFSFQNKDNSEVVFPFKQKGKVYLIDFWNRSCPSCIKNLPLIERLQRNYNNDTNIKVISLYCPIQEDETKIWFYTEYLERKKKIPKINYYYTEIGNMQKYGITTFPHFYLIGKTGNGIEGTHIIFDENLPNNIYEKIETLKNQ